MDSKTIRIVLIVVTVILFGVLACICLSALGVGGLFSLALAEPEEVTISLDVPVSANVDEQIVLNVRIENLSDKAQSIDSIDIFDTYLDGLVVVDVDPDYSGVDIFDSLGQAYTSYTFLTEVPPGGSVDVEFSLLAAKAGDYSGEIDVCINSFYICQTLVARTVIDE